MRHERKVLAYCTADCCPPQLHHRTAVSSMPCLPPLHSCVSSAVLPLPASLLVCRYDLCDLLAHLYRQLHNGGYEGVPIHAIYRDEASGGRGRRTALPLVPHLSYRRHPNEAFLTSLFPVMLSPMLFPCFQTVQAPCLPYGHLLAPMPPCPLPPAHQPAQVQDFTQAEMLLDMRVVPDPNRLFYSGDTAQTIARGIGFRFAGERKNKTAGWWRGLPIHSIGAGILALAFKALGRPGNKFGTVLPALMDTQSITGVSGEFT